jgi:hypothetical protein
LQNPEPGNFAGVVMEMVKIFRKLDIDRRESKILWFLIGELQGKMYVETLLKTVDFCDGTGMPRQHVDSSIKLLIKKRIVRRQTTTLHGCYWYSFDKQTFGRVVGVKTIKQDVKGLRLIEGGKSKKLSTRDENQEHDRHQNSDGLNTDRHRNSDTTVTKTVTLARTKSTQSSSRGDGTSLKSQREKELLAHEARKRDYLPKGDRSFSELMQRVKNGFGT